MQGSSLGETHETHGKHTRPKGDLAHRGSPLGTHDHTLTTGNEVSGGLGSFSPAAALTRQEP